MGFILQLAKKFFYSEDWAYQQTDMYDNLMLNFGGKNGQWRCLARVHEEQMQFIFYSFAPVDLRPKQYAMVSEYAMRANFGLFIGNFELNYANWTLQYRTSIDVEDSAMSMNPKILKHLVYQNVLTMDKYLPGLLAVLNDGISLEKAVQQIES